MDGRGVPLSLVVSGANVHDCKRLDDVLCAIVVDRKSPPQRRSKHLCADAGYRGREHIRTIEAYGSTTTTFSSSNLSQSSNACLRSSPDSSSAWVAVDVISGTV